MAEVVIIDYGMGNIHSVHKSIMKVIDKNSSVRVSSSLKDIKKCSHIVFPGQGAASECMNNIKKYLVSLEFVKAIKKLLFLLSIF